MAAPAQATPSVYQFSAEDIRGAPRSLRDFAGQVLLIVNTASRCGFTPQLRGLQSLHDTYSPRGFTVLGFPCNQFAHQEPGTAAEIEQFCALTYKVRFPLFAKINVNGPSAHPLFAYLTSTQRGLLGTAAIKWNFTKFLVDRHGHAVARFAPGTTPESLQPDIEKWLVA